MKRYLKIGALGFIVLAILSGCAQKKLVEEPLPGSKASRPTIEPEAKNLYGQAERAFQAKNFDEATRLYRQVRSRFPKGRAQALSAYRLGIISYYREQYPQAAREFETFLRGMPNTDLTFDATYNLAACQYQEGQYDKAYAALNRLRPGEIQAQGTRRSETVYALMARTAVALGNHRGAVSAYSAELLLPVDESTRHTLEEGVDQQLSKMSDRTELTDLLNETREPGTQKKIADRIAALTPAETPPSSIAPPIALPETQGNQGPALSPGSSGDRFTVGVVLPLSGRFSAYGKKALDGIILGSHVFGGDRDSDIRLVIRDTASNPLTASQAVEDLVTKENVIAVVGPLNFKESVAAAEKAQQLGVLNLSLAGKEGISEKGPYLFQNALTPGVQLESLVRYCISERHFRRFAIIAPKNNFGRDMMNQFWDQVEKNGARVVSAQTYSPDQTDFQTIVAELTGLKDVKYRKLETTKLAEFVTEQKAKTGKEPKVRLQPLVDFDAIFVPDGVKTLAQLGPSLAYYDVNNVALLGTTEWNTDQLYVRGGRYVEGAIFPGALSLNTKNAKQQAFIKAYFESFGSTPDLLSGQAYEAMELISTAIHRTVSGDRNELVNQLLAMKEFETPLGNLTFDNQRIARRHIPIYTLESGGSIIEH